jgi:hypothetical protein
MSFGESTDFLKEIDDNLDLTVDLDEILTLADKENVKLKPFRNKLKPKLFEEEFSDFVCGIPEKSILTFPRNDFFENNSADEFAGELNKNEPDENNYHRKFLPNLRTKLLSMIQKEKEMQYEIKKLLNTE